MTSTASSQDLCGSSSCWGLPAHPSPAPPAQGFVAQPVLCRELGAHLGFSSGAARVEDEELVLGVAPLGLTLYAGTTHQLVPPRVHGWVPGGLRKV